MTLDESDHRDRLVFFEGCEDCAGPDDLVDQGAREYRTSGTYAYFEGLGSAKILPLLGFAQGEVIDPLVGHVRHYGRGLCSASAPLSTSPTYPFEPGLRQQVEERIVQELMTGTVPHIGRVIDHVDVELSEAMSLIGAEDCSTARSGSRDYIRLRYRFKVFPKLRLTPGQGERYWYQEVVLWWRFVVGPRHEYIYCHDTLLDRRRCERMVPCAIDADCAMIPGASCNPSVAGGACENPSFLDVADGHFAYAVDDGCGEGFSGWECREIRRGVEERLAATSRDPYGGFFALLLDAIEQEYLWGGMSEASCTSDDDCASMGPYEVTVPSRCGTGPNGGICEYRPGQIYGVNLYPDELELVLATDEQQGEWGFFTSIGVFGVHYCDATPSLERSLWSQTWMH